MSDEASMRKLDAMYRDDDERRLRDETDPNWVKAWLLRSEIAGLELLISDQSLSDDEHDFLRKLQNDLSVKLYDIAKGKT